MRDDRRTAGQANPAQSIAERRPAVRHEAGSSFGQISAEHLRRGGRGPDFDQVTREVGARDKIRIAGTLQRAFIRASDTDRLELFADGLRPLQASAAGRGEPGDELRMRGIEVEPDDVNRSSRPSDRNFDTGHIVHAECFCASTGLRLALDFIVIGQRPECHPTLLGPACHFRGRVKPIGNSRMAVQIGVHGRVLEDDPHSTAWCAPALGRIPWFAAASGVFQVPFHQARNQAQNDSISAATCSG